MKNQHRNVPLLLLRTREALMGYFRPVLNKHQLTEQQWRIVRSLHESKELEPHELCQKCCILSPSMAGILKRMQELDLIVKVSSPTDKRRVLVKLAKGVDKKVEAVLADNRLAYNELAEKIGQKKLEELAEQLEMIIIKLS
ncbi:homoprotocatechuate degradation operon regulator HpaR [Thorsellia kenyensis]|uniref:Homoprotocatechuate degradation operon regulator HpaR n=1 Tax=Thorsellia kenyensis TaxID=1549888 RepID=A0ABV6CDG7_9GAMM